MRVYFKIKATPDGITCVDKYAVEMNVDVVPRVGEHVFINLDPIRKALIKSGIEDCIEVLSAGKWSYGKYLWDRLWELPSEEYIKTIKYGIENYEKERGFLYFADATMVSDVWHDYTEDTHSVIIVLDND
jgi:hypothetical protein